MDDGWYFVAGIVAVLVIALLLELSQQHGRYLEEMRPAFRWGNKPRRWVDDEPHWACSHPFLCAVTCILLYAYLTIAPR